MSQRLRAIASSSSFQAFIVGVIVFAGVIVGLETDRGIAHRWETQLLWLDRLVLAIFVVEIAIKMGAEGARPWRYFADPWNVFDFAIVAVCLLPFDSQYLTVLRLARLLRVLRLITAVPRLQVLVSALLKSLPSMAYVSVLLGLLFYVYAVSGVFLFGESNPDAFGSLPRSLLTLFQTVTLEGWTDILDGERDDWPLLAPMYFVTFILVGTMVMLNLFVGVILRSMEEAHAEVAGRPSPGAEADALRREVERLHDALERIEARLPQQPADEDRDRRAS